MKKSVTLQLMSCLVRTFVLMCFLAVGLLVSGQQQGPVSLSDSLSMLLIQKPAIFGKYDTRNSFITGRSVKVRGVKAGLTYGKRLTLGVGYSWLKSDLPGDYIDAEGVVIPCNLEMQYGSLYTEYVFYQRNKWAFSIPIQLSLGKDWYMPVDASIAGPLASGWIVLYEPAMAVEYSLLKYLGVGGGVGYRLMLWNNNEVDQRLNAPTYLIKINVRFGDWYNDIWG